MSKYNMWWCDGMIHSLSARYLRECSKACSCPDGPSHADKLDHKRRRSPWTSDDVTCLECIVSDLNRR